MFENHAGINLTETKLQIVEISHKENFFYLENVDQVIFKYPLKNVVDESKLINLFQESFRKINSKKKLNTRYVSFTLPSNFFKIFEIPYDETLTKKDLIEHFRWEISVLFPNVDKDNFYIQHIEVNKSSIRKEKRAVIFALQKNIVSAINSFCKANALELKYVDNSHLASNAFIFMNKEFTRDDVVVSLYIDQQYSSIAAMEGVNPFYFKVLNSNGSGIFDEIDSSIASLKKFEIPYDSIKTVVVYGQNITSEFIERVQEKFNLPVNKINPFEHLKVSDQISNSPFYQAQNNSFTAATGIAIRIL